MVSSGSSSTSRCPRVENTKSAPRSGLRRRRALVAALSISASVVDSSPFFTNGALVVANAGPDDQDRVYRWLMKWGMSLVVVAPVLTWVALVLPTS